MPCYNWLFKNLTYKTTFRKIVKILLQNRRKHTGTKHAKSVTKKDTYLQDASSIAMEKATKDEIWIATRPDQTEIKNDGKNAETNSTIEKERNRLWLYLYYLNQRLLTQ